MLRKEKKMATKTIKTKSLDREMSLVDGSINIEKREATFTCSSEHPVERTFWTEQGAVEGYEVLIHTPEKANLTRLGNGGSLRDEHWGPQIGVLNRAVLTAEKKTEVTARYSKREDVEPIWQDVVDNIRRNVSLRYFVTKIVRTDRLLNGKPIFELSWEGVHVAHVADAADPTVGLGRSGEEEKEYGVEFEDRSMPQENSKGENKMTPEEKAALEASMRISIQADADKKRDNEMKEFKDRETEFNAYIEKFRNVPGVLEVVKEAREKNIERHIVGGKILDLVGAEKRTVNGTYVPKDNLGMDNRDLKTYSFQRVLQALVEKKDLDGVEGEAHKALLGRGVGAPHGGILIPYDIQSRKTVALRDAYDRDQTAGTGSAGGFLVSSSPLSMVDLLRNKQVTERLGCTRISGLRDNVYMPRQTGATTAYWVAEAGGSTESAMTFGQIAMLPKTVSGFAQMTRQLIMQSNPSIEALAMNDVTKVLALAADLAAISGLGASAQPLGFLNSSGIGSFTGASVAWANILSALEDVSVANAEEGALKWLGTPGVRTTLMGRAKETGYPVYLMGEDQKILSYPFLSSNQMSSATLAFGDFKTIVIGEWGGLEIKTRDSLDQTGGTDILGFYSIDVAVRQVTALTVATSVS